MSVEGNKLFSNHGISGTTVIRVAVVYGWAEVAEGKLSKFISSAWDKVSAVSIFCETSPPRILNPS